MRLSLFIAILAVALMVTWVPKVSAVDDNHIMHHDEAHTIIDLLDDMAERIKGEITAEKDRLSTKKTILQDKIDQHERLIAEQEGIISQAKTKKNAETGALNEVDKEIQLNAADWAEYEGQKGAFEAHLNLIAKIRTMITGSLAVEGDACGPTRECHTGLACKDGVCARM